MNYNFAAEKLKYGDTNYLFYKWMKNIRNKIKISHDDDKENIQFKVVKIDNHKYFVNLKNKTAFYTRIGHYSTISKGSVTCYHSGRKGVHNLKPANKEFDPFEISTTALNFKSAAYRFLLREQYRDYRICVILRDDNHTTAVFFKRDQYKIWHIYLFNTLNAQFRKFNYNVRLFPRLRVLKMFTRPGADKELKCDVYSFEEMSKFFFGLDADYPFNREDAKIYNVQ